MVQLKLVPKAPRPQPWKPAVATEEIRRIANSGELALTYRENAKEQLHYRGLVIGDVLHALKQGFVYTAASPATRGNYYKYVVESKTPNSGNRAIRVVVIPAVDADRYWLKVLEVMWVEERCYVGRR